MSRKIRELIQTLKEIGFYEIQNVTMEGKDQKFAHVRDACAVTLIGQSGDDAKPSQERHGQQAMDHVKR